jgi:outer membrane protein assembly factor BamA
MVDEGEVAAIKGINIVGNNTFPTEDLSEIVSVGNY